MANEEGVKIIITAEDRFSETMKKIDASSKIFGETTKNTQRNLEALEKEMIRLVANGLDPADNKIKEMKANYDKLNQSLKGGDASLKKSNQQWTNLALVIQDLPYGFRGIQNNLPALIGGFAGVSGAAYVLGSALIAIWTAYGDTITEVIFKTNSLDKANKQLQEGMVDSVKSTSSAREELFKVAAVIKAGKDNLIDKSAALDYYNKQLGTTFGAATTLEEAEAKMIEKTPKYIEAIGLKAKAQFYYAKAAEYAIKGDLAGLEEQTTAFDKLIAFGKAFQDITVMGPKGIIKSIVGSLSVAQNKAIDKIANQSQLIGDILFKNGNDAMNQYFKGLKTAGLSDKEIADIFKKLQDARDKALNGGKEKNTYLLDRLKAQQKAYKDDIYAFRAYGILIINEEERLAVAKAKADGTYLQNKKEITDRYQADRLTNNNLFEENLNKVLDDNAKIRTAQEKKELEIQVDNRLDIAKAILAINKKFAEDDLRNAILFAKNQTNIIETELAVQDKLNKNSLTERIEYTKQALAKLAVLAAYSFDPKVLAVYLDSFDKVNAKLKGMGTTWEATSLKIKGLIEGVMSDSISQFAENIGKSFNGEDVDIFGGITEIIATGLQNIGKALIAYGTAMDAFKLAFTNPFAAIAAGIVLVATGAALQGSVKKMNDSGTKTKKFANGGIISGPTMGLMGEYPGARTNPEVVAPLDKLKDMIGGGGGGTFMLRGQDLLLSVNRAQKASNLKGQNISLA